MASVTIHFSSFGSTAGLRKHLDSSRLKQLAVPDLSFIAGVSALN
jgi:hypothetical protein